MSKFFSRIGTNIDLCARGALECPNCLREMYYRSKYRQRIITKKLVNF